MKNIRAYLTAFRLRAQLETQYRGAAIGGLVTQLFFGLILVFLYQALHRSSGGGGINLAHTITYVWLQQFFFRAIVSSDTDLIQSIRTGAVAYTLCRPVNQYAYWYMRALAQKTVGCMMRAIPMAVAVLLLPRDISLMPPASLSSALQFVLSLGLGFLCISTVDMIVYAVMMRTLDDRGIANVIKFTMLFLSGNILPLTLFPDGWQTFARYQPFAQALDAPIRLYTALTPWGDAFLNMGIQCIWIVLLYLFGASMWQRNMKRLVIQGG